jgi:hypothetical protein
MCGCIALDLFLLALVFPFAAVMAYAVFLGLTGNLVLFNAEVPLQMRQLLLSSLALEAPNTALATSRIAKTVTHFVKTGAAYANSTVVSAGNSFPTVSNLSAPWVQLADIVSYLRRVVESVPARVSPMQRRGSVITESFLSARWLSIGTGGKAHASFLAAG